jgi:hypothetical protein
MSEPKVLDVKDARFPDTATLENARNSFLNKNSDTEIISESVDSGNAKGVDESSKSLPEATEDLPIEDGNAEQSAKDRGWIPKEEFKGDKSKWIDAKEYLQTADLRERISQQSKFIKQMKQRQDELIEFIQNSQKRVDDGEVNNLKSARIDAIKRGDVEAVDAIDKKMQEIIDNSTKALPSRQNDEKIEVDAFVARNKGWFNESTSQSRRMMADAIAFEKYLAMEHPEMGVSDRLKEVEKEINNRYIAPSPKVKNIPAAEPRSNASKAVAPDFASLPADIQQVIEFHVKQSQLSAKNNKNIKVLTRERYIDELIRGKVITKNGEWYGR